MLLAIEFGLGGGAVIITKRKAAPVRRAYDFDHQEWWTRQRCGRNLVVAALGAGLLAACAAVAPNTLSPQEVAGLKLTAVAVSFKPDAQIQWDDGLRLYAESKGLNYLQLPAGVTPEEQTFMRDALTRKLKEAMTKDLGATLHGSRPVRLDVSVTKFDITSPLQRVVLGGGYSMNADVNIVDARTGAVLLPYPNVTTILIAGNGIGGAAVQAIIEATGQPAADRVIDSFASQYAKWLAERPT
jgi:hypothetical protein